MNPNFSKIFYITLISVFLALIYNHFNPNGLNLVREERILNWEKDSLASFNKIDTLIVDNGLVGSKQTVDSGLTKKENKIAQSFKEPRAIKIDFAFDLFKHGIQFIDARSQEEYSESHIKGAINIPFYGSENYSNIISKLNKQEIFVTYCSSAECDVSTLSGDELFEMGFKRVYVFIGGFEEWTKNNYPISTKIK